MKLNRAALKDRKVWEDAGFSLPEFDMDAVAEETYKHPAWVHMGEIFSVHFRQM